MTVSTARDIASERQARLLAGLLDHDTPPCRPDELPPLGHWLLFPPDTRQSGLGVDGHPARDNNALPRRMCAGSRVRFLAPIPLGSEVVRTTETVSCVVKTGRSGPMRFETLRHCLTSAGRACIEEEQDIVYRAAAAGGYLAAPPRGDQAPTPPVSRTVVADPVQLFRFSALTFNAHRIHYDVPYATGVERYPGLVVHGPLLATLLMDHYLRDRPRAPAAGFAFRPASDFLRGSRSRLG